MQDQKPTSCFCQLCRNEATAENCLSSLNTKHNNNLCSFSRWWWCERIDWDWLSTGCGFFFAFFCWLLMSPQAVSLAAAQVWTRDYLCVCVHILIPFTFIKSFYGKRIVSQQTKTWAYFNCERYVCITQVGSFLYSWFTINNSWNCATFLSFFV